MRSYNYSYTEMREREREREREEEAAVVQLPVTKPACWFRCLLKGAGPSATTHICLINIYTELAPS